MNLRGVLRHAKILSTKITTFKVTRENPELVSPAEPIPYKLKYLSDIDDQGGFRYYIPLINFYPKSPSMEGKDPVKIIRDAIAKALVFYYPLAGRLRECDGRKLAVECTGQGVMFVEGDADVMLHHLGDSLCPPFPYLDKLLLDIPNNNQVTRLKCGGFIFGCLFNHTMCDGGGLFQFLSAVGELARGAEVPSILPVWERHLLTARIPPRVSFPHREYDDDVVADTTQVDQMVERSFLFSADDISALRRSLPPRLQSCSRFEALAGCVWRCRTIALSPKPDEVIRFLGVVDMRKRMNPPLPVGYYGNVIAAPAAVTTTEELSKYPLHYAVELVRKAKDEATAEYLRSVADLMIIRDRPSFTAANTYFVSDLTHGGFEQVDLGWGTAVYGGAAKGIVLHFHHASWYIPFKDKMGKGGIMVPLCLPPKSMKVFVKELQMLMNAAPTTSAL